MTGLLRADNLALADMTPHLAAWADLAERCLEPCVFAEPAFAIAAARHLARPPGPSFVLVWAEAGGAPRRLVGLCAVTFHRLRGLASAFSHEQATAAFPLLDRDAAGPAFAALLGALSRRPSSTPALLLTGVPVDGPTAALIRLSDRGMSRLLDIRTRAVLRADGSAPAWSGKPRKELRRQARRMAELGQAGTESALAQHDVQAAFQRFLALEAVGWKGRAQTALRTKTGLRAFAESAIEGLSQTGQCRIESLTVAGTPVAMGVVLRSRDHAWFWKIAFDEAFARFSPGVQLTMALTERLASDRSLALTDSCAVADHPMIDRLWPDRVQVGDLLVPTSASGHTGFRAAVAIDLARRGIRVAAKRLRNRLLSLRETPGSGRPNVSKS